MKRALRIGLVLLVAVALIGAGARWYLTSHLLARKIHAQLADLYGGDVEVGGVDVWVASSSVSGLAFYEKEKSAHPEPWLRVDDVQTDLSAFDLVSGAHTPGYLKLNGAKVLLRFDANGNLVTTLPDRLLGQRTEDYAQKRDIRIHNLPHVSLENSQITLRKENQDFVLQNVNANLTLENDRFVLSGTVESPSWGKWALSGGVPVGGSEVKVALQSEGAVLVTQARLNQLPYVPANVWKTVQIQKGETAGRLQIRYDLGMGKVNYRVELEPRNTDFTVPEVDLKATGASGKVVIDDGLVQLRDVSGQAFGGTLRTDADLDFRTAVTTLRFHMVEAPPGVGPRLEDLPKKWLRLPDKLKVSGILEGSVSLTAIFYPESAHRKARVQREGSGVVRLADARLNGFAAKIGLNFQIDDDGFGLGVQGNEMGGLPEARPEDLAAALVNGLVLLSTGDAQRYLIPSALLPIHGGALEKEKAGSKEPAKTGKEKTSYFNIDLSMKDLDLSEFSKSLEFKLPFDLVGKASFSLKISIPLDRSGDLRLYKAHGTVELRDFMLGDLKLEHLDGDIEFKEGLLTLNHLKGRMPADPVLKEKGAGTFIGQATFQVEPLGDLKVNVVLDRVPLGQVAKLAGLAEPMQGEVSGKLSAVVPGKDLSNPKTWIGQGRLTSARVAALGWNLEDTVADLSLKNGNLEVSKLTARLEGARIEAAADLSLGDSFPFKAQLSLGNADLSAIERLSPRWKPPVKIAGQLQTTVSLAGTASPLTVRASGLTVASNVQFEKLTLKNIRIGWELEPGRLNIKELRAELYEGEVTGTGSVPLDPERTGAVEVQVKNLDAGALARSIPTMPFKLQGKVDGRLKGELPAAAEGKERAISVQIDLAAPKLRVQNIPTEQLQGTLEYRNGAFLYRLQGKSLGGTFELKSPEPPAPEKKEEARKGQLRITNLQVTRLLDALGAGDAAFAYQGSVSVEFNYVHEPDTYWPEGTGRMRVSNLRYRDTLLVNDATADVFLAEGKIRLKDFSTTLGAGLVRAQGSFNLKRPELSWYTINMDRVEAGQLLAPFLGDMVKGEMNARIRGKLGTEWTGTADIEFPRATLAGLQVGQWRIPVQFRYSPRTGSGELVVYDSHAQIGAGRMTGKVTVGWDYAYRVEGQLRFFRINVENLLKEFVGSSRAAGGLLTGRFDFNGRDMRSLDDLQGTLDVSFEQSQAMNLPVLKQVSPFLGINPSTTFQKGVLHARLANGFFRVQSLGLEGNNVSLFAQGTLSLAGRVDLDVQATTGTFGIDPRLQFLGLRIPAAGPIPLLIAQEAATLLSNRVVHLRVTGTLRSPTIRVLPLATLTQEGIRYFLNRTVGPLPFNP